MPQVSLSFDPTVDPFSSSLSSAFHCPCLFISVHVTHFSVLLDRARLLLAFTGHLCPVSCNDRAKPIAHRHRSILSSSIRVDITSTQSWQLSNASNRQPPRPLRSLVHKAANLSRLFFLSPSVEQYLLTVCCELIYFTG